MTGCWAVWWTGVAGPGGDSGFPSGQVAPDSLAESPRRRRRGGGGGAEQRGRIDGEDRQR